MSLFPSHQHQQQQTNQQQEQGDSIVNINNNNNINNCEAEPTSDERPEASVASGANHELEHEDNHDDGNSFSTASIEDEQREGPGQEKRPRGQQQTELNKVIDHDHQLSGSMIDMGRSPVVDMTITDEVGGVEAKCFGQLVLSVDLAPITIPNPPIVSDHDEQTATTNNQLTHNLNAHEPDGCRFQLANQLMNATDDGSSSFKKINNNNKNVYQVELSLCMKKQVATEQPSEMLAGSQSSCQLNVDSNSNYNLNYNLNYNNNHNQHNKRKRELVYERFERFSWPIEPPLNLDSDYSGAGPDNNSADQPQQQINSKPISSMVNMPFKARHFDSAFCFNLLNARMANIHDDYPDLAERMISKQRLELIERNWLEMEELTTRLRLDLLHELSRLVKANGEYRLILCVDLQEANICNILTVIILQCVIIQCLTDDKHPL